MTRTEVLAAVFTAGREAALAADPGPGADGGSCNFDTPMIRWPHTRALTVRKAAEAAGVNVSPVARSGFPSWLVRVGLAGQGARRTKMAEAACVAMENKTFELRARGLYCSVWYQLD